MNKAIKPIRKEGRTTKQYTLKEAAEELHVTVRTLYSWIKSGTLAAHKVGGHWRVSESVLKDLKNGTGRTGSK